MYYELRTIQAGRAPHSPHAEQGKRKITDSEDWEAPEMKRFLAIWKSRLAGKNLGTAGTQSGGQRQPQSVQR